MDNEIKKKPKWKYFLSSSIWILAIFIGYGWIKAYEKNGEIYLRKENYTLYGEDAKFMAYSVTITACVGLIYSLYVSIKAVISKEPNKKMKADEK